MAGKKYVFHTNSNQTRHLQFESGKIEKLPVLRNNRKIKHKNCFVIITMIHNLLGGGAKVLGKLPVLGRPTNLDYSRASAYCTCSRCGWGLFGHFFSHLSLLSFSL